jgi:hypothetical protein
MATQELTGAPERADHTVVDDRSDADRAAFAAASYVRRQPEPTPDLPPLPPSGTAARRRVIASRR